MSKRKHERIIDWDREGPTGSGIRVEFTDHFDARGMRRVYGRGDHFGRQVRNMDVWRSRDGRLLARFWSRNEDVDWCSFEIIGLDCEWRRDYVGPDGLSDEWVPELLRDKYDNWVVSEM